MKAKLILAVMLFLGTPIGQALACSVCFGARDAKSTEHMAVAMLVATFKAGMVAAIFMHLSNEKRMIYRILVFTALFVLGLFFLTYLAWYDPIVR